MMRGREALVVGFFLNLGQTGGRLDVSETGGFVGAAEERGRTSETIVVTLVTHDGCVCVQKME